MREASEEPASRRRICASVRGSLQLIEVDDIRYFLADQKYVSVVTPDCEILIEETLKALEEEFADRFVRIHRNALVARRYITGLERDDEGHGRVQLSGMASYPRSESSPHRRDTPAGQGTAGLRVLAFGCSRQPGRCASIEGARIVYSAVSMQLSR